jgi:D-glycerate 3-kinase
MYSQLISDFVENQALPDSYREDAFEFFVPLVDLIANRALDSEHTLYVGINGAQGTGKTTLGKLLVTLLSAREFRVANFSIDDFYLTQSERNQLAESQHPLLATRGVPGTHDISLLMTKFEELKNLKAEQVCELPRFNKAIDDRCGTEDWQKLIGPIDAVILEGWFVGAPPQATRDIELPINALEKTEDADGSWRKYANYQLADQYQSAFDQLDLLIMLKAPSFKQVSEWRSLQEEKLKKIGPIDSPGIMDEEQLARFIQHYERLTRHCLEYLPVKADVLFDLDTDHRIAGVYRHEN